MHSFLAYCISLERGWNRDFIRFVFFSFCGFCTVDLGDGRWLVVDLMICSVSFIIFFIILM